MMNQQNFSNGTKQQQIAVFMTEALAKLDKNCDVHRDDAEALKKVTSNFAVAIYHKLYSVSNCQEVKCRMILCGRCWLRNGLLITRKIFAKLR